MRITLVRHGETTGQSSTRYYGATDVPLSDVGVAQMQAVAAALAHEAFQPVFSSELCRSKDAATLIAGSGVPVTAVGAFNEVCFGRWEGWTRDEIIARDGAQYRLWQQGSESFCYPEGESRQAFRTRVVGGLEQVLLGARGANILMVLHKGVIAVILAELLGLTANERQALGLELGSIHQVGRDGERWQPIRLDWVPAGE